MPFLLLLLKLSSPYSAAVPDAARHSRDERDCQSGTNRNHHDPMTYLTILCVTDFGIDNVRVKTHKATLNLYI